jgi:hypothetical protein
LGVPVVAQPGAVGKSAFIGDERRERLSGVFCHLLLSGPILKVALIRHVLDKTPDRIYLYADRGTGQSVDNVGILILAQRQLELSRLDPGLALRMLQRFPELLRRSMQLNQSEADRCCANSDGENRCGRPIKDRP